VHSWTLKLSAARIQKAYPGIGRLVRLHVTRRDGHGQWGGRVVAVVLDGRKKDVTLSGDAFRSKFGLRSSWFAG
jgi:stage II sporulation protein D